MVDYCDQAERGFVVITNFVTKVNELAQETPQEMQLRKFAAAVGRQGINLRTELAAFEVQ